MNAYSGGCHCGNIAVSFETSNDLDALPVRECQCSFCRAHGVRTSTDPGGRVAYKLRDAAQVSRYRFGKSVAEFLICRKCGVYVGAVMTRGVRTVTTLNVNILNDNPYGERRGEPAHYDEESADARAERRLRMWTPAELAG